MLNGRTTVAWQRGPALLPGLLCLLPALCEAQSAPAAEPPTALPTVVVTGSHIRQTDLESALPVQVITREQIDASGLTTVEQVLQRVPANFNATLAAQSVGNTTQQGLAAANLRGLGSGSTLVLLNGRRLANYAFNGETVDLNSIPVAAIERVEVLKDGASAIYGTDAIAGVINFILRKDYSGGQLTGHGAWTQNGGGNNGWLTATLGTGSLDADGYNVFATVGYQREEVLWSRDRGYSANGYRPDLGLATLNGATFPANIVDRPRQRVLNPALADGCQPPHSLPARVQPFNAWACGYDPAGAITLLPETERMNVLVRATWRASEQAEWFAEVIAGRNEFRTEIAPMPLLAIPGPFGSPTYPAGGPYYPVAFAAANGLSGDLILNYRVLELGGRRNTTTSDAQRYAVGVDGQVAGWSYGAAIVYSANQQETAYDGSYLYSDRILAALRSGLINPWGPSGPEGHALLDASVFRGTPQFADASTSQLYASASRELLHLPAGPLALALGAEVRNERLSYDWDPAVLVTGSPIVSGFMANSGSRSVYALFAELAVPVARGLDAQLAVRWDDYTDVGSTVNPKVALRWQPASELLLRGSWSEGFRAPPLYALHRPVIDGGTAAGVADPVRCPVTGSVDDCHALVPFTTGGNPGLEPETSTQWNVGIVLSPLRSLSLGIDYWSVEQQQVIATPDPFASVNYSRFPSRVLRGPPDPATPGLPGPIIGFDGTLMNLGATETSGVDVFMDWMAPVQPWGALRLAVQGTYVRKWTAQTDGYTAVSALGDATQGLPPVPRWRSTATLDWSRGAWGATLVYLMSTGYAETNVLERTTRSVGKFSNWDLQGRYSGFQGWQLAAGIQNLLDEDPPASAGLSFQWGYNALVGNPLGRVFYVRAGYAWR